MSAPHKLPPSSFIFQGSGDTMYVAYPLNTEDQSKWRWHRRVEFLFSQIFGTCAVLATSAAVWYLLDGNGPLCVASAVLASVCSSYFWSRVR
jgi:hypothetical protein